MLLGLDGRDFEIDLSSKNATKLRAQLQPWLDRARPAGHRPAKKTARIVTGKHGASGYNSEQLTAVRTWARKNGWPNLSDRGKVAAEVLAAFEAAGGVTMTSPEFSSL